MICMVSLAEMSGLPTWQLRVFKSTEVDVARPSWGLGLEGDIGSLWLHSVA